MIKKLQNRDFQGMEVVALDNNLYRGLKGEVVEVRSGKEKETGNEGEYEIIVDFDEPPNYLKDYPELNGTSLSEVIMNEYELGFYLTGELTELEMQNKTICPKCYHTFNYERRTKHTTRLGHPIIVPIKIYEKRDLEGVALADKELLEDNDNIAMCEECNVYVHVNNISKFEKEGKEYCNDCRHEIFKSCQSCEEDFYLKELDNDSICYRCRLKKGNIKDFYDRFLPVAHQEKYRNFLHRLLDTKEEWIEEAIEKGWHLEDYIESSVSQIPDSELDEFMKEFNRLEES